MMDSSTPCWKKPPESCLSVGALAARWQRWLLLCLLCMAGWGWSGGSRAQGAPAISQMQVERVPEGLLLSATLQFDMPEQVEDALRKGIPMYFVQQAQVLRTRWYWSDQEVAQSARYLRLSYQPLTRRWRLHSSSTPFTGSGMGLALSQTYDELADAMGAMQRVARWKIAENAQLPEDTSLVVQMRFGLDLSQLPRPLQIGVIGRSGWNLQMAQSLRLDGGA